jgi:hypothetical protein
MHLAGGGVTASGAADREAGQPTDPGVVSAPGSARFGSVLLAADADRHDTEQY